MPFVFRSMCGERILKITGLVKEHEKVAQGFELPRQVEENCGEDCNAKGGEKLLQLFFNGSVSS